MSPQMRKLRCPYCFKEFSYWFNNDKEQESARKELQHHLWGTHSVDVIESHEIADTVKPA